MKKFILITLIFLLQCFSFSVFSQDGEVYYCIDESKIGFNPKLNYKITSYTESRFKVLINFKNKYILSKDLYMDFPSRDVCKMEFGETLVCSNFIGTNFSINKNTLKFHLSKQFLIENSKDDISISHGKCEKF